MNDKSTDNDDSPKRRRVSSSSESDSLSSDSLKKHKRKKHKKHYDKEKHKVKKQKKGKKMKKDKTKEKEKKKKKKKRSDSASDDIGPALPPELAQTTARSFAPVTKEQWETKQKEVRKVYDEETGRYRMVRGDGEIIEEIVSRDRHKEINKKATQGDGAYFQSILSKSKTA